MKIVHLILQLSILAITLACSGPKSNLMPVSKTASYRVAVLSFSNSGFLSSRKHGKFAADELAKRLFLKKKALVVDRSIVNAAVAKAGIVSTSFLTHNQLKNLAQNLNVQTIILGEVQNLDLRLIPRFEKESHLLITYRLLDPDTGTIVGVVSHEKQGGGQAEKLIQEMIAEMTESMKGFGIQASKR